MLQTETQGSKGPFGLHVITNLCPESGARFAGFLTHEVRSANKREGPSLSCGVGGHVISNVSCSPLTPSLSGNKLWPDLTVHQRGEQSSAPPSPWPRHGHRWPLRSLCAPARSKSQPVFSQL